MVANSLTFEDQEKLLASCSELAENMKAHSADLREAGYKSFVAWEEFELAFCEASDIEKHARCVVERARKRIGSPDGIISDGVSRRLHVENCPCHKRLSTMQIEFPDIVAFRRDNLSVDFLKYRDSEMVSIVSGVSSTIPMIDSSREYSEIFGIYLVDAFKSADFRYNERRARAGFPVVSKPLIDGWDICWSPESNRTIRWPPRERSNDIRKLSMLDLRCYASATDRMGSLNSPVGFKRSSIIKISVQQIVNGFEWAYSRFNGIEELPLVISAHAHLYKLVGQQLEDALRHGLEQVRMR